MISLPLLALQTKAYRRICLSMEDEGGNTNVVVLDLLIS